MRKLRAAAAVALALLYCGTATAETFTTFPSVVTKSKEATDPEVESGYVPLATGDGKSTRKMPTSDITRNNASQTLTHKNINCLENNCTNFPGGSGGDGGGTTTSFIPPTACAVEGELYNNGGTPTICHISVASGAILVNSGGHLALNAGGILLSNQ